MATGIIKWFDHAKGYGFIIPDAGGVDVFVHANDVAISRISPLNNGDVVEFELGMNRSQRPKAINLRRI